MFSDEQCYDAQTGKGPPQTVPKRSRQSAERAEASTGAMEKLIIASVAVILLLKGADSQGAGEQCSPYAQRRRLLGVCDAGFTCDETADKCKINKGGACDPEGDWCGEDTFCDEDDSICKVKAGKGCTPGVSAHCLEHATCDANDGNLCQCDTGYTANDDLTECSADGGQAGMVVSLTLMAVSLLACRLF